MSHSVKDIESVRRVRNSMEERGANPILFYFKQDVDDELLQTLISREIDARNFFVLCDSENARASAYVQWEAAYVAKLRHVKRATIDLAADWHEQDNKVDDLLRDATIFVSYAHSDGQLVKPFIDYLIGEDFALFDPSRDIAYGADFITAIQDAINEAGRTGHFVQFLTHRSFRSKWTPRTTLSFRRHGCGAAHMVRDGGLILPIL